MGNGHLNEGNFVADSQCKAGHVKVEARVSQVRYLQSC